jgi:hypothetical protein
VIYAVVLESFGPRRVRLLFCDFGRGGGVEDLLEDEEHLLVAKLKDRRAEGEQKCGFFPSLSSKIKLEAELTHL